MSLDTRYPLMVSLSNHRRLSFDRLRTSGWVNSRNFAIVLARVRRRVCIGGRLAEVLS